MITRSLLLIDLQRDYFRDGEFPLPGMERAAKNAAKLLFWARENGLSVVHVRHEELDPAAAFLKAGSEGVNINETVAPINGEVVITKNYPNAFRETTLDRELSGAGEIFIAGAMSNMCIDATARAAFDMGFNVTIVHDACAASELEFEGKTIPAEQVHGAFMAALASAYGQVVPAEEAMSRL